MPPTTVIGGRFVGVNTGELQEPIPGGDGNVERIERAVGRNGAADRLCVQHCLGVVDTVKAVHEQRDVVREPVLNRDGERPTFGIRDERRIVRDIEELRCLRLRKRSRIDALRDELGR
jgi:hypothetical protein